MQRLEYDITIAAPRRLVWQLMTAPDSYRLWTAPFAEGSYYEGSWDEGSAIHFLSPAGGGMVARIAEHQPAEWISIQHLGMIENGVEDTTSDSVKAWAPAFENYRFTDVHGGTALHVACDTADEWKDHMERTWPLALAKLKEICEAPDNG